MTRLFEDHYTTTLTSGIDDTTTTIPVASVTNLPPIGSGDTCILTIQFGSTIERVNATAVSSLNITATRGHDGSSAETFPSGALVSLRLTASALEERVVGAASSTNNSIPRHSGTSGKLLKDSDVFITDDNQLQGAGVIVNPQTDDYSILASDNGALITMAKATPCTATLPDPDTVDDGFQVAIAQHDAGTVSVATAAGSIVSKDSFTDLAAQYSLAVAVKMSSTVWALYGDLA